MAFKPFISRAVFLLLMVWAAPAQNRSLPETANIKHFRLHSALLSRFWGRDMFLEAGVVLPPGRPAGKRAPVCYSVHGFGGSYRSAWFRGPKLLKQIQTHAAPPMIYVYLQAQFSLGHHEFADSVNNGPWGTALVKEFIPALEEKFLGFGRPQGRFLTGHSSGGWSSFWLQIRHPDFFNGTWSTSPDSVDFRDFTGIDIYRNKNAYLDSQGQEIPLVRRGTKWVMSIKGYVKRELERGDFGGQFASFDAVFSPRGRDGRPMPLFDRKTGRIDPFVAEKWKKYDIRLLLKAHWQALGPRLTGKLHLYIGTLDTFRLEGAARLLKQELQRLGSDAEILLVKGRDHGTIFQPHPRFWPEGMLSHIHRAMWSRFQATKGR